MTPSLNRADCSRRDRRVRVVRAVAGVSASMIAITLLWNSTSARASTAPLSSSLDAAFDAGIGSLVIAWDPADTRPLATRRQALFDFMYQTYQSSAWIPQSLFDANAVTQAVVGDVDTIVEEHVGLVRWKDNPLVPAYGMAPNRDSGQPLGWTVNCLVCHMAEIDGVAYFGAGTKTFDDLWLGTALKRLTSDAWRTLLPVTPSDDRLAGNAHRILTSHHHDKIDSLTRARSTAFAASHVEMFMRAHDYAVPPVDAVGRGDVKTPPLWHTASKLSAGRWYTDGSFHGRIPLMASSMELEKDQPFDALIDSVIPTIKKEFDDVLQYVRAPRYPYAIDRALADRGRALFNSRELGCAGCHGVYDGVGGVDWPAKHLDVGTDPARLDVVSDDFIDVFNRSPLAVEGRLKKSRGYAATPLTGVWANYPYLHNGSVPTLHDLLGPVAERPMIFEVKAARTLDQTRLGQPIARRATDRARTQDDLLRRYGNDRDWFNTERPGSSNAGHDLWPQIRTDERRRAILEYLKTL